MASSLGYDISNYYLRFATIKKLFHYYGLKLNSSLTKVFTEILFLLSNAEEFSNFKSKMDERK